MTEKELQEAIVDCARLLGWRVYHTFDSRRSEAGFPDLVLVRGRKLLVAELKRDGKHPTPPQREWLDAIEATGTPVFVWRPADWLDGSIEEVLR